MIHRAKHKVLTYFIQYGGQFEIQISDIFFYLKKDSMIVFNTIYICYKFQSLLILDIYIYCQHFFGHVVFHFSQSHHLHDNVLAAYKVTPPILISRHIFL